MGRRVQSVQDAIRHGRRHRSESGGPGLDPVDVGWCVVSPRPQRRRRPSGDARRGRCPAPRHRDPRRSEQRVDRVVGVADAGGDADARGTRHRRSPGPAPRSPRRGSASTRAGWPTRYCGSPPPQRTSRVSTGSGRDSPSRSATSATTAAVEVVVGALQLGLVAEPADRRAHQERRPAGQVRPLRRRHGHALDQPAGHRRHEQARAGVDVLGREGHRDHGHRRVRDPLQRLDRAGRDLAEQPGGLRRPGR